MSEHEVHVFIVAREIVFNVEADTERESLEKALGLANDAPLDEFSEPSVGIVAITHDRP